MEEELEVEVVAPAKGKEAGESRHDDGGGERSGGIENGGEAQLLQFP